MKKIYCQKGHPNEILACFCNRCGEQLGKVSTAKKEVASDVDYAAFLKFSEAQKNKKIDSDEDEENEVIPVISELKVRTKPNGPGKITLGSVINTATPGEGDFQRPRNQVDVDSFMKQREKWMTSRNEIEV